MFRIDANRDVGGQSRPLVGVKKGIPAEMGGKVRVHLLGALFFVLSVYTPTVLAQTSRSQTPPAVSASRLTAPVHFYFCASNQIGRGHTAYISNIFAVSKQNSPPIENEYLGFLKKRYSYPARETACFDGYQTEEEARAARQTRIKQFDQIEDKAVETPWTYSAALSDNEIHPQPTRVPPPPAPSSRVREAAPGAAPAPTAVQPPATTAAPASPHVAVPTPVASGNGKPYYCFGYNDNKNLYFSDTFEVPPNFERNRVMFPFLFFLAKKYGLSARAGWEAGVDCKWGDKTKHDVKPGYKIIETGWKPETWPPPESGSH